VADVLLVAGGAGDPNLGWLVAAASGLGVDCRSVAVDPDQPPALAWRMGGSFSVDGTPIDATALFCRYDVFSSLGDATLTGTAAAWFASLIGYGLSRRLGMLNARLDPVTGSKTAMLALAETHGLAVPETLVCNSLAVLPTDPENWIAKPVGGGSYAMSLSEALAGSDIRDGRLAAPAIVQPRLVYPERRVYRVGDRLFVFDIAAETLDSRLDPGCTVQPLREDALPPALMQSLLNLTDAVAADFCAIYLKTDPRSGELVFLELNNSPMFVGYDRTTGGRMAEAMVNALLAR